jgi:class 3 adenylate cyclase
VRDLSLDQVERLPRGLFLELNTAAQAFNSMVVGLRWFETYVPKRLVQRLVGQTILGDSGGTLQSKDRNVTVMFTDIAGFTSLSESMPAADVAALLNRHFALVTACIEAEGGTVDKFIGDCVMAFWGAPDKQKDHAARACRAAVAIAAAVKRENAAARAVGGAAPAIRIGMHTGPVVVGNIGAPGRINYTIVGDTVNTANRLEQFGKEIESGGGDVVVVLSGATLKAAKQRLDARPIGTINVRGRQGQVEAFCLRT